MQVARTPCAIAAEQHAPLLASRVRQRWALERSSARAANAVSIASAIESAEVGDRAGLAALIRSSPWSRAARASPAGRADRGHRRDRQTPPARARPGCMCVLKSCDQLVEVRAAARRRRRPGASSSRRAGSGAPRRRPSCVPWILTVPCWTVISRKFVAVRVAERDRLAVVVERDHQPLLAAQDLQRRARPWCRSGPAGRWSPAHQQPVQIGQRHVAGLELDPHAGADRRDRRRRRRPGPAYGAAGSAQPVWTSCRTAGTLALIRPWLFGSALSVTCRGTCRGGVPSDAHRGLRRDAVVLA